MNKIAYLLIFYLCQIHGAININGQTQISLNLDRINNLTGMDLVLNIKRNIALKNKKSVAVNFINIKQGENPLELKVMSLKEKLEDNDAINIWFTIFDKEQRKELGYLNVLFKVIKNAHQDLDVTASLRDSNNEVLDSLKSKFHLKDIHFSLALKLQGDSNDPIKNSSISFSAK